MYRLAELDADSAGMVRIIDYFDALLRHGADAAAMLRASAALADCVVGMRIPKPDGTTELRRCSPRGVWSPQPYLPPSSSKDVVVEDGTAGAVWIERDGPPLPLDDMLVDRMALTAAIIVHPRRVPTMAEHSANLLMPMDRSAVLEACSSLRIDPSTPVRVVAAQSMQLNLFRTFAAGRAVEVEGGDETFLLCLPTVPTDIDIPENGRVGVSLAVPASEIHDYLDTARFARRQATSENRLVSADQLGALLLLAPGAVPDASMIPDIASAAALSNSAPGQELLDTLRIYLHAGTLRAAADRMHLHHSSVAQRLLKLSQHLGFGVDIIEHRARATAMMMTLDGR